MPVNLESPKISLATSHKNITFTTTMIYSKK